MAVRTRYSIEDYIALEGEYPDRKFKPDSTGAPVEMSPDKIHGFVQGEILFRLKLWLQGSHWNYNAGTEIIHRLGDQVSLPDVALVRSDAEDYPQDAPLLAVEVRSQSNTWRELRAKAARYLEYGSAMVWLVDPRRQTLELHLPDAAPQRLSGNDVVEGGDVLPGFRVTVSELFPD